RIVLLSALFLSPARETLENRRTTAYLRICWELTRDRTVREERHPDTRRDDRRMSARHGGSMLHSSAATVCRLPHWPRRRAWAHPISRSSSASATSPRTSPKPSSTRASRER